MRTVVTDLDTWKYIQKDHWGLDFAFDFETTGLSFIKHDVCGLAITFSNNDSYYLVFQHTVPAVGLVSETYTEKELVGYDEEIYYTPKKQLERRRQVPIYTEVVRERTVEKTTYPTEQFINPRDAAKLLNYMFAQDVLMIAHNLKFDLHFLVKHGIEIKKRRLAIDTMNAAKLIDENRYVGLKELAPLVPMNLSAYKELEHYPGFHKDEFLGVPLEHAAKYAMMDTECAWLLWNDLFQYEIEDEGVADALFDMWMPNLFVLQEMEHKGIAVDLEKVHALKKRYETELAEADRRIMVVGLAMVNELFDAENAPTNYTRMLTETETARYAAQDRAQAMIETDEGYQTLAFRPTPRSQPRALTFNAGSNDHLTRLFYDHYKLKIPEGVKVGTTNGGRPVDKNMLKIWQLSLGEKCPAIIADIQKRREAEKFVGTYLDRLIAEADPTDNNCVRTSFNQHITDTGRLSSSNPNLQNINSRGERGKEARDVFIARPDHKLIVADYSSMELVVASHYAAKLEDNHTMMRAINEGMDLHALTASTQFDVDYQQLLDDVANDSVDAKLKRMIGKTSNFGLLYGMGKRKFQVYLWTEVGIFLELDEVQRLIDTFNETYQTVTDWKQWVIETAHSTGYVKTIGKRKRRLPDLFSKDKWAVLRAERQAINAVIQGSCADIIQWAMPPIQEGLHQWNGYLLLQVHDELVGEIPNEHVEKGIDIVQRGMVEHINPRLRIPLKATAHAGLSWGAAKA